MNAKTPMGKQLSSPLPAVEDVAFHRDDEGPAATEAYGKLLSRLDADKRQKLANHVSHGWKATLAVDGAVVLTRRNELMILSAAPPAPAVEPVALTDAQIDALWDRAQGSLLPNFYCLDQRPVLRNRIFARAVLAAAQEVEFTDDPVPTYKPGPPLEWEEGGA